MSDELPPLYTESVLSDMEATAPLRPVKEYEDIVLREVSMGFSGGPQDLTLYPEDTMESDDLGNVKIVFVTLGGGEFVAYAGHTQWHSIRKVPHRREKGTLRPDAQKMLREFGEQLEREKREKLAGMLKNA